MQDADRRLEAERLSVPALGALQVTHRDAHVIKALDRDA
jgi:hypothetical protein